MFPLSEYDEGTASSSGGGGAPLGGQDQGGQGGQGQGGAPEGGGGSTPVCNGGTNPPVSGVVSDFDALGPSLALLNCAALQAGELVVEDLASEYCWVYTTGSHSLACSSVTFRILAAGSQQQGVQRFVYIREPGGPGDMQLLQELDGFSFTGVDLVDSSFQLPRDTWWRLSADEDTITFETSSDGATWVFRGSGLATLPLDNVTINIGAGNYLAVPDPGIARFDCLNVPPPCGD